MGPSGCPKIDPSSGLPGVPATQSELDQGPVVLPLIVLVVLHRNVVAPRPLLRTTVRAYEWRHTVLVRGLAFRRLAPRFPPALLRLLRPKDEADMAARMPRRSEAWRSLSPCIFAEALLEPALGMSQQETEGERLLTYPRDAVEAVAEVQAGRHDVAVLLDGVPLTGMAAACDAGERLPHKSTYFYPKLATGLVMNPLDGTLE